ncbi:hypothetical protein BDQ12DRAFT_688738 [Crucibulum laeve]|uniref:DUF6533 domain-containing protein n=1 Tax=Crucibulum laeve TaxID=68775 RepID=A0A5C3M231_9AGAR|nr:hypothetical protein BDQ12DRAFT_688738 [Crucibulum laeve]
MSSPPPPPPDPMLALAATNLKAAKYFQLAAFIVLLYDHILTFPEEVQRIWSQKLSVASILFLINRYITPIQFVIIIDAFHDPIWTETVSSCRRFVAFEGASTVTLVAICELIMIMRVYALYERSRTILIFLMTLWMLQVALSSVGIDTGFPVPLPDGFIGCIFTGSHPLFPAIWVTPLISDCAIFSLTLWRTRTYLRHSRAAPTTHVFIRDGLLYFLVIFMANLLNTLLFFLGADDIRAIGASFSQLITATMISRLVLNLRSVSSFEHEEYTESSTVDHDIRMPAFVSRTIGNLGQDIDTFMDEPSQRTADISLKNTHYRSRLTPGE